MKKKKILFLPADSLPFGLTRSYWLSKTISKYHKVYLLRWHDPRTKKLIKEKGSILDSPVAFFKSLFRHPMLRYEGHTNLVIVKPPIMLNAFINHIFGISKSKRIARKFNKRILNFLVHKLKPDVIFYGDCFYYFPAVEHPKIKIFADLQDDFEIPDEKLFAEEIHYISTCLNYSHKAFAVTPFVCERFSSLCKFPFQWLPNGVEFHKFYNIPKSKLNRIKKKLKIDKKFVISYIGSKSHIDIKFVLKLSERLLYELPEAIILIIGVNCPLRENIINIKFISPKDIHFYFLLSDVGIFCPPNLSTRFVSHSLPLKILQYSAAKKFVLSFPIKWLEENNFPNIYILPPDVDLWIQKIKKLKNYKWNDEWNKIWEKYQWDEIIKPILKEIQMKQ